MTKDEILGMEAGLELDAAITRFMGWERVTETSHYAYRPGCHTYSIFELTVFPNYSTDIKAAWEVVEKMMPDICINYLGGFNSSAQEGWHACIKDIHVFGCKTAPEAICKAALLVMLDEGGQNDEK